MSWRTTENCGFKVHTASSSATEAFDLDQALNYNWQIIDGWNPDTRLQTLENSPVCDGAIWQGSYTGNGQQTFTIDYSASTITTPSVIMVYGLDATSTRQSLLLFPIQSSLFKAFDSNYSHSGFAPYYQPTCTFNMSDQTITITKNNMDTTTANPYYICNEANKKYSYIIIGNA